jgi:hypothetical protein
MTYIIYDKELFMHLKKMRDEFFYDMFTLYADVREWCYLNGEYQNCFAASRLDYIKITKRSIYFYDVDGYSICVRANRI